MRRLPAFAALQLAGVLSREQCERVAASPPSISLPPSMWIGQHFWERAYFVSTVGRDEEVIDGYIRNRAKDARPVLPRAEGDAVPAAFLPAAVIRS